jgi:hypothetical protein
MSYFHEKPPQGYYFQKCFTVGPALIRDQSSLIRYFPGLSSQFIERTTSISLVRKLQNIIDELFLIYKVYPKSLMTVSQRLFMLSICCFVSFVRQL